MRNKTEWRIKRARHAGKQNIYVVSVEDFYSKVLLGSRFLFLVAYSSLCTVMDGVVNNNWTWSGSRYWIRKSSSGLRASKLTSNSLYRALKKVLTCRINYNLIFINQLWKYSTKARNLQVSCWLPAGNLLHLCLFILI